MVTFKGWCQSFSHLSVLVSKGGAFIAISCPGNGAYCLRSQGALLGTFQWRLWLPEALGLMVSPSAEVLKSVLPGNLEKTPNCKIVAKSVPLNTTGWFFFPTWACFLSGVAEEGGRRGGAPAPSSSSPSGRGDAWHPSALRLALGSGDQEKQDGCLCHIQDIFHHKDETWEVCNLLPGIISAWVRSSKLLRWDNWQDN